MRKPWVGLLVVVAALVLAGCVARTGPRPAPISLPLTGEVDPCSLTGPAAYEPYGRARVPGRPDLDSCTVSVSTDEGAVRVSVGEQTPLRSLSQHLVKVADLGRGARIVQVDDGLLDSCDMALAVGAEAIKVSAVSTGDEVPSYKTLCRLTRGAAKGVFEVLANGREKVWTPAPNSFVPLDACEILPKKLVADLVGVVAAEASGPPSGHWCVWAGDSENQAMLRFQVAEDAQQMGVPASVPAETIGGRESFAVPDRDSCSIVTRHIRFEIGVGTYEFAALDVQMAGDACVVARALAAVAWANLPSVG